MSEEQKANKGQSRRDFLKNAGMGIAAVTGGSVLAGCSPQVAPEGGDQAAATNVSSWRTAPDPIPDSEIAQTKEADIIIIGAGTSGLVTGVRATEEGAKVIVIAKGSTVSARGGSNFAIDTKLTREHDININVEEAYQRMLDLVSHHVNEKLWWIFAHRSGEAMDWLIDKAEAAGLTPVLQNCEEDPIVGEYKGTHLFIGGPNAPSISGSPQIDVCNALVEDGRSMGMEVNFEVTAEQLVREENGRVTAVIARESDGTYTKYVGTTAVVLATGDYGGNAEMKADLCPIADEEMVSLFVPVGHNSGDGHQMATWVGAAMQRSRPHAAMIFGSPDITGSMATSGSSSEETQTEMQMTDAIRRASDAMFCLTMSMWNLAVNKYGERFENEHTVMGYQGIQLLMQPDHKAVNIYDSTFPDHLPEIAGIIGGEVATADDYRLLFTSGPGFDTLEELAEAFDLPVENLVATVERYNELCENGKDEDFGKPARFLHPLANPPYFAMVEVPQLLITVGGLRTTDNMEVLDEEDNVIPGLYAVGTMIGDFFANNYTTTFPGHNLGRCVCFGYLTGQHLAAQI